MADTNTYVSKQKVEKWTTKEKFSALGNLRGIEPGTEYNLTGAIEESDLDSALQTKINGKLTAPTTPTAESAITMLADGTVGTKPLSEIGGGKLYRHDITMVHETNGTLVFTCVSCIRDSFIDNNFSNFPNFVVLFNGYTNIHGSKIVKKITKYEQYTNKGRGIMIEYEDNTSIYEEFAGFNVNVQDSITEE